MQLKDKVTVITGASDGIGREIALRLAKAEVQTVLVSKNESKLQGVVEEIVGQGGKARYYVCDIRDNGQIKEVVQKIVSDFGRVEILINNAGIWQKLNYLEDIDEEEIEGVIRTNLVGMIQMTRVVLPHLKEAEEAAIINVSSRSGVTAQPGQAIYCASKWGVRGFTEVLKVDLKDTKIRVAGIYQGGVATKLLEKAGDKITTEKYTDPKDIADLVSYMLSRPEKMWLHEVRVEY